MQQIEDWLKQLGLSEYAQRFAESDIDIDVLSELTDQDFDRLGVSLGIAGECCEQSESLMRQSRLSRSAKHRRGLLQNRPSRTPPSVVKSR
jgi:hypothetical protein